jgi:very-short-patch-repair endonuclease
MKRPPGPEALDRARNLRRFSTEAEKLLWSRLRARRLEGFKFRRQVWIGNYVADFLCAEARLVVEADGSQHADQVEYDGRRTIFLEQEGFSVVRIWNNDVTGNIEGVLSLIRDALLSGAPSPSHSAAPSGPLPLPCRERG